MTEVHQRPRFANTGIAGAQYRAASPPSHRLQVARVVGGVQLAAARLPVELQNLGHGSSGCGGKLLFACGWCGAHPYQELRQTALSGELADDVSARRDLRQMGEGARRDAGNGALEQHGR